ncbi:MAG: hypothetical protein Hyperionvirus15_61 [Hyperionvirus sp.]|uniref:3'-phosphate/5'-hydroxy nucleic acid ligase n=1 Tax=Hyperionvirus sp. TaxID=2487770 RepID=A0A3G5ADR2_9VIRU|nr:MAG: hypothetical protein Hyperionvirus15_61 [Hyperionvirus sp.]
MSYKFDSPLDAIIYLERGMVEGETFKQIAGMLESPVIRKARFMPDVHAGTGCCVGFTAELAGDKIIPRIIGPDIGCGVLTYCLENSKFKTGKYEKKFDAVIQKCVPMGNGYDKVHEEPVIQESQYEDFFVKALETAKKFSERFSEKFGVNILDLIPEYSLTYMKKLCEKVSSDYKYDLRSMGTLGGSNHFVEVGEYNGALYFTVHTGSRNIGSKICRYHQDKMDNAKLPYLSGSDAYEYYFDMIFAQMYAMMNRRAIMSHILVNLNIITEFKEERVIESVHNYIDFEDMIIRKGAIPARKDQSCIIALNMRDGIIVCKGKGNPEWNNSAAHGCGRIVNRNRAKKQFSMKQYKLAMKEVYSSCVNLGTIDEAPMAYKDSEMIMQSLGPTVEILFRVKPTLNVKGASL